MWHRNKNSLQQVQKWDFKRLNTLSTCMNAQLLSLVRLFATPWTVAHQTPLIMGFSRQDNHKSKTKAQVSWLHAWCSFLCTGNDEEVKPVFHKLVGSTAWTSEWEKTVKPSPSSVEGWHYFFFPFIFIIWRLITLQYCSGFCHTLTWISHGFTCVPHPNPSSHLPLHPISLGLSNAPALSTCLMHPIWAGNLFHPW